MLKNYKITLSSFMASKYFMNDDVLILRLPEEFPFNKCGETIIQLSEKNPHYTLRPQITSTQVYYNKFLTTCLVAYIAAIFSQMHK